MNIKIKDLKSVPWKTLKTSKMDDHTDDKLLIKYFFEGNSYGFLIFDSNSVFFESISADQIENKFNSLNPLKPKLRSSIAEVLNSIIDDLIKGHIQFKCSSSSDSFSIKVSRELTTFTSGIYFNWEFNANKLSDQTIISTLVEPLVDVSAVLVNSIKRLTEEITKRDQEIADYREQGVTLTRQSLATEKFDQLEFYANLESTAVESLATIDSKDVFNEEAFINCFNGSAKSRLQNQTPACEGSAEPVDTPKEPVEEVEAKVMFFHLIHVLMLFILQVNEGEREKEFENMFANRKKKENQRKKVKF